MDWHSTIRVREPADDPAIVTTITAAFAGSSESAIVKALSYAGDAFMALELAPGSVHSQRWTVTYPRAFSG